MADYRDRPLICIDFDGTIAAYDGWRGIGVFGDPIPGTREGLNWLREQGYQVCVFTTRGEVEAIADYMGYNELPYDYINDAPVMDGQNPGKPPAKYFIDDRAVRFEGSWKRVMRQIEELDEIEMTKNGAAYHVGITEKPTPERSLSCGCKEEAPTAEYCHAEIRCWCGEELAVEGGAPDFIGDGDWSAVTMSYSCPIHGQYTDKPRGIGISGKARSGKNTAASILSAELGWPVTSFASALKHEWFSWAYPERYALNDTDDIVETVDQMKNADPAIRQQLIEYGQRKREIDPAYWIKTLNLDIPQIIADVRFQNEMDTLRAAGFYMIRIACNDEILAARGCPPIDDISEYDLDDRRDWNMCIWNNSSMDAFKQAAKETAKETAQIIQAAHGNM